MRKLWIILALLVCLLLTGCGETASDPDTQKDPAVEATVTKEDVIAVFEGEARNEGCVVTDCVVAEDGAYDLIGVVQYTNADGGPCWLAFVKEDYSYPVGLDANNILQIAEDSVLTYLGEGKVSLSLLRMGNTVQKEDGETQIVTEPKTYDYTVSYSYDPEENNTAIVTDSQERE